MYKRAELVYTSDVLVIKWCACDVFVTSDVIFRLLEELSNITYSCLLTLTVVAKSGMIKPAQCIALRDTVPTTAIAQPGNTMPPI